MSAVPVDAWDLRHMLLSLEDRPRARQDGDDLDAVVARAVASLAGLPPPPAIRVRPGWTAPFHVEGIPVWIVETNAWLLAPAGRGGPCVIVDVPPNPAALVARIRGLDLRPVAVVLTHAHFDHAGGVGSLLRALDAVIPVHVHPADVERVLHPEEDGVLARVAGETCPPPARALQPFPDGAVLTVGPMTVRAVHTPGHTPGSTCVLVEGGARTFLCTGDTLFAGGTGRCDLPGGSRPLAELSLRSLLTRAADDVVVLPGHGATTTVGRERAHHLVVTEQVA